MAKKQVEAVEAEQMVQDVTVVEEGKSQAAIHNQKAHALGVKWGKEVQKRNGADMKHLRQALDIITDPRDILDVVEAYREAGGDGATSSKIKKILTISYSVVEARAIVFDETSNSLQGCYKKIRELEKGETAIDDGEGDMVEAAADDEVHVPESVNMDVLLSKLQDIIETVASFDPKAVKLLEKAQAHMMSYSAASHAGNDHWPFQKTAKEIFATA